MKKIIVFILVLFITSNVSFAQELRRRPNLGVSLKPLTPELIKQFNYTGNVKMYVKKVIPNTTGSSLKIMDNDIIIDYAGVEIGPGFYETIKTNFREGDNITATVFRNGKIKKLKGKVVGTVKETSNVADITYDYVDYNGGKLRSIIWKPKNTSKTKLPAIYYVQGFSCASVEQIFNNSNSSIKQLLEGFVKKGYIVYRVEKIGMGDSMNNQHCVEVDVQTEIKGFKEGLKRLKKYDFVDADNVFIWGHSLGGQEAPFIAEGIGVKGIIGYGYVAKSWHDYIMDLITVQLPMIKNLSYGAMQDRLNDFRMPLYDFFYKKESLEKIVAKYPKKDLQFLSEVLQYNGKTLLGRTPKFLQSLNSLNVLQKHQEIKIPTLALYGSSDLAAIDGDKGVQLIAAAINQVSPGNGYYQIIPDTNHHLSKVGTMDDSIEVLKSKQTWQNAQVNFNMEIVEITHNWIKNL